MDQENLDINALTEERRKALAASIQTVTIPELKKLGEQIFPTFDNPWRETYFGFLAENPTETFHHAKTHDGIHFVYCHAKEKGMWFLPGRGMGPLQPRGLKIIKQIVETGH